MKKLGKNQKEKARRSRLLLGGPLMGTMERSPRGPRALTQGQVVVFPKILRWSEGELFVARVRLAVEAVYMVVHMPHSIAVAVRPRRSLVPGYGEPTPTLGASTERTFPPEPEYQCGESDQNDQTHDLERAHISLLCASGTVWILFCVGFLRHSNQEKMPFQAIVSQESWLNTVKNTFQFTMASIAYLIIPVKLNKKSPFLPFLQ